MQIVALDKTGTITSGEPKVTDMIPAEGISEEELLGFAYALERKSEHPLAHAILQEAQERRLDAEEVEDFQAVPGNGLSAVLAGKTIYGGNKKFIQTKTSVDAGMLKKGRRSGGRRKDTFVLCERRSADRNHCGSRRHQRGQSKGSQRTAEYGNPCGNADRRQ